MRPVGAVMAMLAVGALLGACGEKPQAMQTHRGDVSAYQGVENRFAAPDWKAGDKVSWEQALKARAQYTQNEYTRTPSSK